MQYNRTSAVTKTWNLCNLLLQILFVFSKKGYQSQTLTSPTVQGWPFGHTVKKEEKVKQC